MKKVIILFLILAISISIKAQSTNDSITIELTKLSKNSNLVGFSVAIVNKDGIVSMQKALVMLIKKQKNLTLSALHNPLLLFLKHRSRLH